MTDDKGRTGEVRAAARASRLRRSLTKRLDRVLDAVLRTALFRGHLERRLGRLPQMIYAANRADDVAPSPQGLDEMLVRLFAEPDARAFVEGAPDLLSRAFLGAGIAADIRADYAADGVGARNTAVREAWLERVLSAVPAGARILDAGAGECQFKRFCAHLNYVSQDLGKYDGTGETGLQTGRWDTSGIDIRCDITDIPEPDASFDAILCTEVLEHLPEPTAALNELARLIRPSGLLVLTAPFASLTHFAPYHYVSGFNRFFYLHHLDRLGFDIVELEENGDYYEYMAQEMRRIPTMAQTYSDTRLTQVEEWTIGRTIALLDRLQARDHGSKELLHLGIQVLARKR